MNIDTNTVVSMTEANQSFSNRLMIIRCNSGATLFRESKTRKPA